MFVGEAPGFHEDRQGAPFVGQAGKVLERLLQTIGLSRPQVYIANVLKCRPPGNRDPQPEEIEACEGHLFSQVELIRPKVVCTLGNFATKLLSGQPHGITRVHGRAAAAPDRRRRPRPLPDLPSRRGALHAGDDDDARGRLRAAARAALRARRGAARAGADRRRRAARARRRAVPSPSPSTPSWVSSSLAATERIAAAVAGQLAAAGRRRRGRRAGGGEDRVRARRVRRARRDGPGDEPDVHGRPPLRRRRRFRCRISTSTARPACRRRSGPTSSRTSTMPCASSSGRSRAPASCRPRASSWNCGCRRPMLG